MCKCCRVGSGALLLLTLLHWKLVINLPAFATKRGLSIYLTDTSQDISVHWNSCCLSCKGARRGPVQEQMDHDLPVVQYIKMCGTSIFRPSPKDFSYHTIDFLAN